MVPLLLKECVRESRLSVWVCFWDVADSYLELLQASGCDRDKPTHFLSTLGVFPSVLLRPVPVQHRKRMWMMVAFWNINEGSVKSGVCVCVCVCVCVYVYVCVSKVFQKQYNSTLWHTIVVCNILCSWITIITVVHKVVFPLNLLKWGIWCKTPMVNCYK